LGRFAVCTEEDGVEACLSAAQVNLKLFEEDLDRNEHFDSAYLLAFAQTCIDKATLALDREKQCVAEKGGNLT